MEAIGGAIPAFRSWRVAQLMSGINSRKRPTSNQVSATRRALEDAQVSPGALRVLEVLRDLTRRPPEPRELCQTRTVALDNELCSRTFALLGTEEMWTLQIRRRST